MSWETCEFCKKKTDVALYGMAPAPWLCEKCYEKITEMSDEELKKRTMKHYDRVEKEGYILLDYRRWMYKYHFAGSWNIRYAESWKEKIYKVNYENKMIYIDSRGNCLNDEQDLKQYLETIRDYVKYMVRYACDYYYQFISIKTCSDGFVRVIATNFRDCSEGCYQMYTPRSVERTTEALVILLRKAEESGKSLSEIASFCKEELREVKEEEEQEMLEALRESIKESPKSIRKRNRKIIKKIMEFYGEKEVAERLLSCYKHSILRGRSHIVFTDAIVTGIGGRFCSSDAYLYLSEDENFKIKSAGKDISHVLDTVRITYYYRVYSKKSFYRLARELFPEWYEKCYVPAHTHLLRKRWKEIAKISEESLLQSISYFFQEVRE